MGHGRILEGGLWWVCSRLWSLISHVGYQLRGKVKYGDVLLLHTGRQLIQLIDQELLVPRPSDLITIRTKNIVQTFSLEGGAVSQERDFMFSPPLGLWGIWTFSLWSDTLRTHADRGCTAPKNLPRYMFQIAEQSAACQSLTIS